MSHPPHMQLSLPLALLGCLLAWPASAETWNVNSNRVHLRSGDAAEWTEFAKSTPSGKFLEKRFNARANPADATLFIRQDDVRQDWAVELNGKRLGKLFLMEADLVHALVVPARTLRDGTNVLVIKCTARDSDDILLHEITIDGRSPEAAHDATLAFHVNGSAGGVPARITIVNAHGALAPLLFDTSAAPLAVRPGVAYTGSGAGQVLMPAGSYTVYTSRGIEWSVATQRVDVVAGKTVHVELSIKRELALTNWISCDTHVHTFTYSKHGDATLDERMLTVAGEGIELPIATDHNLQVDYAEPARRLNVSRWFTPVTGNEVTTAAGHFNIFPVDLAATPPDAKITDWPRLMDTLRATPGVKVVVLNHPYNIHNGFQPFAATNYNNVTGENLRGFHFGFDAIELMNSSAQQSDNMRVFRGWFALLNFGYRATGLGSSDCHDVSRYIVGQGRTYIAAAPHAPGEIDVNEACAALRRGRALVSMGLVTDMTVAGKYGVGDLATKLPAEITVSVRVLAPSWVEATNVSLFANGVLIREAALAGTHTNTTTWTIPRPRHDVHLVAIATGPGVTAPFWAIPRPYQPTSPQWHGRVFGATNPIWIDGDGDGGFTPARAYGKVVVARAGKSPQALVEALTRYDEAVAAQAASFWFAANGSLDGPEIVAALKGAPSHVRAGFAAYAETLVAH